MLFIFINGTRYLGSHKVKSTTAGQAVACAPVMQRARVQSSVRTNFLGEVFWGFSSPVRQMSGSFRPPRSPNIIWPSLSSIIIHYGHQWPEMLTRSKTLNIHIHKVRICIIIIIIHIIVCLFPMPTHCTITFFGFCARRIDSVEYGLFSVHTLLGQTTLRVGRVSV